MVKFGFRMVGKKLELVKGNKYLIPDDATELSVKNGCLEFVVSNKIIDFFCKNHFGWFKSSNNRKFFSLRFISPRPKIVEFPEYKEGVPAGYFYGQPQFKDENGNIINLKG